jgi:diguanylate cyclase (GGDEF)-like protein/PAS domain S-box-containing protein
MPIIVSPEGRGGITVTWRNAVTVPIEPGRHEGIESADLLREILDRAPIGIFLRDVRGRVLLVNRVYAQLNGWDPADVIGHHSDEFFPPLEARRIREADREVLASRRTRESEHTIQTTAGPRLLQMVTFRLTDLGGASYAVCGIATDITADRSAKEAMADAIAQRDAIVDGALDAIVGMDAHGVVTRFNPAAERTFGWAASDIVGLRLVETLVPEHLRAPHLQAVAHHLQTGEYTILGRRIEVPALRRNGTTMPVELSIQRTDTRGEPAFTAFMRDITERQEFEQALQHVADHDLLTDLVNRRRFTQALAERLAEGQSQEPGDPASLLVLDIDHFKHVNDLYGHQAGDECLAEVAARLGARLRDSDVLARIGGDEFAILLPHTAQHDAARLAQQLVDSVRDQPMLVAGHPLRVTISIGVTELPDGLPATLQDVMANADYALYEAKETGRDRVSVISERSEHYSARTAFSERIRKALREDDFLLYAQPIVALPSRDVAAYELLLRIPGVAGVTSPSAFLEVAEQLDLIQAVDRAIVGRAIDLLARHPDATWSLHVNVSGKSTSDTRLLELLSERLSGAGVPPERLVLEVTETAAIRNLSDARAFANQLRGLGCRISLDDFGTGFGSFSYLKHLPVDSVKIAGEFVRRIRDSDVDQAIVRAVLDVARVVGRTTIAEWVEDEETLELLAGYGVDMVQGHYTGWPAPLEQLGL